MTRCRRPRRPSARRCSLAAGEVAAQASTSTAAVTRACQHLGFTGLTQLRMLLRDTSVATHGTTALASVPNGIGELTATFTELSAGFESGTRPARRPRTRAGGTSPERPLTGYWSTETAVSDHSHPRWRYALSTTVNRPMH
ncbi:hypothetical protein [Rhodococcus wratislaviensis]|uniref:hypothetical protein n=1 Tax=Rhodococcus wratislaviensis TaxID=44752 RepID=UPI000F58A0E0